MHVLIIIFGDELKINMFSQRAQIPFHHYGNQIIMLNMCAQAIQEND